MQLIAGVFLNERLLRITDCKLLRLLGGFRRINDTNRIHKDGRTHDYMQVSIIFKICFLDISGWSSMQNSDEPVFMRAENKVLSVIHHFVQSLRRFPLKRLGTPSSRLKGKTKAGVRSPVDGF